MNRNKGYSEVIFLRHAKTKPKENGQRDYDRALRQPRAKQDLRLIADAFGNQCASIKTDVLCSPSVRTRETLNTIESLGMLPYYGKISFKDDLYLASAPQIEHIFENYWLRHHPKRLVIIGHNPGLTDLAQNISSLKIDHLPTAGLICVAHPQYAKEWDWQAVEPEFVLIPKALRL
ncbi:MAG: hypothetical protein GVX96_03825 [Bacteroidetes bacterium]|jgi:phosphohistidine phosphatase|nr:hypothetical protein [Bacteroidota bacterium]